MEPQKSSKSGITRRKAIKSGSVLPILALTGCAGDDGSDADGGDGSGSDGGDGSGSDGGDGSGSDGGDGSSSSNPSYVFTTSTSNSIAHAMGTAVASVMDENSQHDMLAQPTSGGDSSLALVGRGETEIGYSAAFSVLQAMNQEGSFSDIELEYDLMQVMSYYTINIGLCSKTSSDIQYYSDLAGKPYTPGLQGVSYWNPHDAVFDQIFEEGEDQFRDVSFGSPIADALKSGDVDAAGGPLLVNGNIGGTWEPLLQQDLRLLGWKEDNIQMIEDMENVRGEYIPNSKFADRIEEFTMEDETFMVSAYYVLLSSSVMGEDTIYELMDTIWNNRSNLVESHAAFESWTNDDYWAANLHPSIPVHPGAAQFLQDKGLWDDNFTIAEI